MAGHSNFIWAASLVVGLALSSQFSALADERKKAEGDDFSEKLKDRFPSEAKRGKKSIFRSVKAADTDSPKKEEVKKTPRIVSKPIKAEEKDSDKDEKPKLMLADLFKSKPKKDEADKKKSDEKKKETESVVAKDEKDEKDEKPKLMLADLFKSKPKRKDEESGVPEKATEDENKEAAKPKVMLADLFKAKPKKEEVENDAPKESEEKKNKKATPALAKKEEEEDAKPKMTLAGLFKGKSKDDDDKEIDKALKEATANGRGGDENAKDNKKPMLIAKPSDSEAKPETINDEKKSDRRISTPKLFGKKSMKTEEPLVAETTRAKPNEKDEAAVIDDKTDKEKENSPATASNSRLFGKKSKKAERVVIPPDSATLKPSPKIEFSKVDTGKDLGDGGDFTSWDDVPGSKKSTVDRMMGKLNIKPVAKRPAAMLPGPRLPGGPSKPAAKSE